VTLKKVGDVASRRLWHAFYAYQRTTRGIHARERWIRRRAAVVTSAADKLHSRGLFLSAEDVRLVQETLSEKTPIYRQQVLERAARIRENQLTVLGYGDVDGRDRINWHCDPINNYQWPQSYSLTLDYVRPHVRCDVKIPWEISRLQFLAWLAEAYCLTDEHRYFVKFRGLLFDWTKENPTGYGVNWACSMEVAIRSCNLLFSLQLFREHIVGDFAEFVYGLLWQHAAFIRRHLEYSEVRGNHYMADIVGLLQLAAFLEPAPEAQVWYAWATSELFEEVLHQFHPDGVHHEHALNYHRLTLEMVLAALLLLKRRGTPIPNEVRQRVRAALNFVTSYTLPDGSAPIIGDADSGRVLWFGEADTNDHRYLLLLGAAFDEDFRFDCRSVPFAPAALWYMDGETLKRVTQENVRMTRDREAAFVCSPARRGCVSFPDGGFHVLACEDSKAMIRCGRLGLRGRGAHDHNDQLSFHLHLAGEPLVVDSGCYSYTLSDVARRETLSSYAHNVVVIDGREQADLTMGSVMASVTGQAQGTAEHSDSDDRGARFTGYHDGYTRFRGLGRHTRTLHLSSDGRRLDCTDQLAGYGRHKVEILFHLAGGIIELSGQNAWVCGRQNRRFHFYIDTPQLTAMRRTGWYAASYGGRYARSVLVFVGTLDFPVTLQTRIIDVETNQP
jgi:hypothetical protein